MTAEEVAEKIKSHLDQTMAGDGAPVEYLYTHHGPFDVALFGTVTKLLIAHYRGKGWQNVEIGRVTSRGEQTFISFLLYRT